MVLGRLVSFGSRHLIYRVVQKSPYTDQYATIILFESLTYAFVTRPANPYVHLDAGHTK